ncbi:MAG: ABC transporter permease [Bacteriovoracaceae bacterium]|nr:ABC transporter permease [Bacteroidota bacterium]
MKMVRQLLPIIKKEFRQIRRDRKVLAVLIVVPAFLLLLNGYALNFDVRNITMAVYDAEKSSQSRELVNSFITAGYFEYTEHLTDYASAQRMIDEGKVKLVLVIPPDFSRENISGRQSSIQLLVDGMDANAATTIVGYGQAVTQQFSQKIILQNLSKIGRKSYVPVNYEARIWYNPEMKSAKFLVPGLIAYILAITAVIATALSIVKEKERNTIEQIDVSPIKPLNLIIGKMFPYAVISLLAAALVLLSGYLLFDVVVKGSLVLLFFATLLFVIAALGQGLLVSTVADSQQVAFQLATVISILPTMILSGFMFPIKSMPLFLQILSNITPAKFYLVIMRGIVLKGVGIEAFWDQLIYLSIYIVIIITISVKRFKHHTV